MSALLLRRSAEIEALAVHDVDELARLLLHLMHEALDRAAEMTEENHRWYGDDQAKAGVVKRDRNAVRELHRAATGRTLRAEDLDHADHRAEQAHQRTDRGDGAQRGEIALKLVRHAPARLLDRILHHVARALVIAQSCREHLPEGRILREPGDQFYGNT